MLTTLSISAVLAGLTAPSQAGPWNRGDDSFLDMEEMLDASTLKVEVLEDWHRVEGAVATRQKRITIEVGELVPGMAYRVPVCMVVPAAGKAKGLHLTGGHGYASFQRDARINGVDAALIRGGVGLVHTMVQVLEQSEQPELSRASKRLFIETLNPRHSIQYWGWPAALMRALTAAHAEDDHFEPGKVALSGASKNGASPAVAIIQDERMTALHSAVAPIWDSPLRLCDSAAWGALRAYDRVDAERRAANARRSPGRTFLGGAFGPVYNDAALAEGHSWEELQALAERVAGHVFITRNLESLKARGADLYFHPGTHDYVAFDLAWGGRHHPEVPVYLGVNSGHGKKSRHPGKEAREENKAAFLLEHFFDDVEPLLTPPSVTSRVKGRRLRVTVTFEPRSAAETGRLYWMYDRGPDGSGAYVKELFPEDQWQDMQREGDAEVWSAELELDPAAEHVDFFSNHRKTIRHGSRNYATYLSSPYTRVSLRD